MPWLGRSTRRAFNLDGSSRWSSSSTPGWCDERLLGAWRIAVARVFRHPILAHTGQLVREPPRWRTNSVQSAPSQEPFEAAEEALAAMMPGPGGGTYIIV